MVAPRAVLDLELGAQAALRTLALFAPGAEFELALLKDPTIGHEALVFQCKARGHPPLVCKVCIPDDRGKAKMDAQHDLLGRLQGLLNASPYRVPSPVFFSAENHAFLMEYVSGETLHQKLSAARDLPAVAPWLLLAGRWLQHFHKIDQAVAAFHPRRYLNTLAQIERLAGDELPLQPEFSAAYDQLAVTGRRARGKPMLRCMIHGDFHTRNLIFGSDGHSYGIDFENRKQDDALRDVMTLLLDVILRWNGTDEPNVAFEGAATAFWNGYGDTVSDPAITLFFQRYAALTLWAKLRIRPGATSYQARLRKLNRLRWLATSSLVIGTNHVGKREILVPER